MGVKSAPVFRSALTREMWGLVARERLCTTTPFAYLTGPSSSYGKMPRHAQAIVTIGWAAMTVQFKVAAPELLRVAKVGDQVEFTLCLLGMASTGTSITVQP